MSLDQLFNEVQAELSGGRAPLTDGDFQYALKSAIRTINLQAEKINEIIKLSRAGGNPVEISGQYTYLIPDDPFYIGDELAFAELRFDEDENSITLPSSWIKVLTVFNSTGVKLTPVPFDKLKSYSNEDTYYTNVGRVLYFNFDVMADDFTIYIKLRRDYAIPTVFTGEYTGMPETGYQLLLNAIISGLMSRPKFFDKNQYLIFKDRYMEALSAFSTNNITMQRGCREEPFFQYPTV